MTKESLLMQYQSECRNALESVVNISKSFQKVFMDAIKLFMAIPDRINFLQMGRYGCFSNRHTGTILRMMTLGSVQTPVIINNLLIFILNIPGKFFKS